MKKLLLFVLVAGFAISGFSQNKPTKAKLEKRAAELTEQAPVAPRPMPEINTDRAVNEDINRIVIGKAYSQRSLRREEPHVIYYNPELDVISVTVILDPVTYDVANDDGTTGTFYSEDHGQTWQGPVVVSDNTADGLTNYYPAGIIFNPEGNTSVADAYGIAQSTAVDWNHKVYGSAMIGGGSFTNYVFTDTDPDYTHNGYWNQYGLQQVNNEVRALNLKAKGDWSTFTEAEFEFIVGELDGDEFAWDFSNSLEVDVDVDPADGVIQWTGMFVGSDSGLEICWSADGETGYVWMNGVSTEAPTGYQPILYVTNDSGDSWDMVEYDLLDGDAQDFFYEFLLNAGGTDMVIPRFFESTGVVDSDGNLQMFAAVGSHSADVTMYPDSTGYAWVYPGDLVSMTFTPDGLQDYMWIDSLNTMNVNDEEGSYAGNGWQHRLFAAKNASETDIFFTWTDTRNVPESELNLEPDIFGWSKCPSQGTSMESPVCFTEGTLYEKFYYYPAGAEYAYLNEDGNYTIPYIQGITPGEFASNGSATADPITVNFITGIEFEPICTVGLSEMNVSTGIEVAQNSPNPFSTFTTININSTTVADVMVEVSNLMGQSVYTINAGTINGSMKVNLPAADLQAGVYFYTVTVGNESVTKKMIVE